MFVLNVSSNFHYVDRFGFILPRFWLKENAILYNIIVNCETDGDIFCTELC
jgi:hypothetical protein